MIKEYVTFCEHSITEEKKLIKFCLDFDKIVSARESVDDPDGYAGTIVEYVNGNDYRLEVDYEDFIKDWQDARGVNIIRLVSI